MRGGDPVTGQVCLASNPKPAPATSCVYSSSTEPSSPEYTNALPALGAPCPLTHAARIRSAWQSPFTSGTMRPIPN